MPRGDDAWTKGRLFIAQGDVTRICCDGWLLPSDNKGYVTEHWLTAVGGLEEAIRFLDIDQTDEGPSCQKVDVVNSVNGGHPWITDIAIDGRGGYHQAALGAAEFVRRAGADYEGSADRRTLLAMPLVGTGEGGWTDHKGELFGGLFSELFDALEESSADLVLVLDSDKKLAAAQLARLRELERRGESLYEGVSDGVRVSVEEMAERIREEKLVLFMGAGISQSAGLPGWRDLLNEVSARAGLNIDSKEEAELHPLDRAWLIEKQLEASSAENENATLGELVKQLLSQERWPSLSHTLLASLPVDETVTTNYDELFEDASDSADRKASVITDDDPSDGRWLLKLHGTVRNPEEIVLSRSDYLDYSSKRAALAGVVQAMLLTRHMLKDGYTKSDYNFLKIVHDVRNALGDRGSESRPIGTALGVGLPGFMSELWSGLIDIVPVDGERGLQIYLDLLLARSTRPASYLFDESFEGLLSEGDRVVRDSLDMAWQRMTESESHDSPAADQFRKVLSELGHPSQQQDSEATRGA